MLETRPRNSSFTSRWIAEYTDENWIVRPSPEKNKQKDASCKLLVKVNANEDRRKSKLPTMIKVAACIFLNHAEMMREPTRAPVPVADKRIPKPSVPSWKTFSASTGSIVA